MSIDKRIKKVRQAVGVSQHVFANRLGVTRGHISNVEKGRAIPSEQLTISISREFEINIEWLKTGAGPIQKQNRPSYIVENITNLEALLMIWVNVVKGIHQSLHKYEGIDLKPYEVKGKKELEEILEELLCRVRTIKTGDFKRK
jgi:transcriptional regulator with XRE-family HTH domain